MGDLSSTAMQAELQRRVTQLATGAGSQALAAINRAIRWINRQGSFTFQLKGPASLSAIPTTGLINAPSDLDPGKALHAVNATNGVGLPIRDCAMTDIWESRGFVQQDGGFDRYILIPGTHGNPAQFQFFPAQSGAVDVTIIYHQVTVDLADGGGVYSLLPRDFDDLVIDLAEAEERRINDVGDTWQLTLARCQDQIKTLLSAYRTASIESGLDSDAAVAVQQKTQIGRP